MLIGARHQHPRPGRPLAKGYALMPLSPDLPPRAPRPMRLGTGSRPPRRAAGGSSDLLFWALCHVAAAMVIVVAILLVCLLIVRSWLALKTVGVSFLTQTRWDPVEQHPVFGALAFVYGTLVTSAIAMLIAVPLGVGTAAYLSEIATGKLRKI